MNSRERVIRAINFKSVDRVPILYSTIPVAFLKYGEKLVNLYQKYPSDFEPPPERAPKLEELDGTYRKGEYLDKWGCLWHSLEDGVLGEYIGYPLDDWANLKSYRFPPFPDRERVKKDKEVVMRNKEKYFVMLNGYNLGFVFERMQALRGITNLMTDFMERPKELYVLLDRIFEYCLEGTNLTLELEPDGLCFGDDWGTQKSLMVNPKVWRELFKPRYKRVFDLVHRAGAIVYFHSDGQTMEIVPDLIEIDVDIFAPQFSCLNLEELARLVNGKMTIASDIDRQYILPFGKPEEVKEYVRKVLKIFGAKEGGFLGRGEVNRDVPLENAEAMYQTFLEGS